MERNSHAIDYASVSTVVVLGFDPELSRRICGSLGGTGFVVCFEPDVDRLRRLLSADDHTAWLGSSNFALFHDADPQPIAAALEPVAAQALFGIQVVWSEGARERIGDKADEFLTVFAEVMQNLKLSVQTMLGLAETGLRNELGNLMQYAEWGGIGDLKGVLG